MQNQPRPWWHEWLGGSDRNDRIKSSKILRLLGFPTKITFFNSFQIQINFQKIAISTRWKNIMRNFVIFLYHVKTIENLAKLQLKKLILVILVRKQFLTQASFKNMLKVYSFAVWMRYFAIFFRLISEEYVLPPTQFVKFVNIYFFVCKDGERGVVLGGGGNYR